MFKCKHWINPCKNHSNIFHYQLFVITGTFFTNVILVLLVLNIHRSIHGAKVKKNEDPSSHRMKCCSRPSQNHQRNWISEQHNTVRIIDHSVLIRIHIHLVLREKSWTHLWRRTALIRFLHCAWLQAKDKHCYWSSVAVLGLVLIYSYISHIHKVGNELFVNSQVCYKEIYFQRYSILR